MVSYASTVEFDGNELYEPNAAGVTKKDVPWP